LGKANLLKHILVRHEQSAAHAADVYARANKVGVCFATSGPGATNLVTGIANARMDSIPMILLQGKYRAFIGTDAFQETDILGLHYLLLNILTQYVKLIYYLRF
jgi:acetolactate synthase-1/2/3 large subunit